MVRLKFDMSETKLRRQIPASIIAHHSVGRLTSTRYLVSASRLDRVGVALRALRIGAHAVLEPRDDVALAGDASSKGTAIQPPPTPATQRGLRAARRESARRDTRAKGLIRLVDP
jgi:hypothetical protein